MAMIPPLPRIPRLEPEQLAREHYEGIKHAFSCVTIAANANTTLTNFGENPEIKKQYQKEQRKIKVTLKRYGIEINEWKQYVSQWA